jgi:hypothetical protein
MTMRRFVFAVHLFAALVAPAMALTGTLHHVVIEAVETAELDQTVLPSGTLVYRADLPKDVRIGDGVTPGGIPIGTNGTSSAINSFSTNVYMNGHTFFTGPNYSIREEGNGFFIRNGTNTILRLFGDDGGAYEFFSKLESTSTQLVVTVANLESDPDPVFEVSPSLTEPEWTTAACTTNRISQDSIELIVDVTEIDIAFYRVTLVPATYGAVFEVPLQAPAITLGGVTITNWPEGTEALTAEQVTNVAVSVVGSATNAHDGEARASIVEIGVVASNATTEAEAGAIATNSASAVLADYTNAIPSAGTTLIPGANTTNLVLTGATYWYTCSPTGAYTLAVSESAPRYGYSLRVFSTNACTLAPGLALQGAWTVTGTNDLVVAPSTGTTWIVYGKGR